eukprot:TRINITY_DN4605_c0_g1_i1.p1 TRINITY_DN4605_c0_g1~~TRINITY_DN4605_c0_g1_i1.p1  ORF type:complete len:500 (-),score=63.06 TRINITY_DN4605_c0_g1_i1:450-1898(-)
MKHSASLTVLTPPDRPNCSVDNPYNARVAGCKRMTTSIRPVYKLSLCVDWLWNPGDAIGILPRNSESTVLALLQRLGVSEDELCCFPPPPADRCCPLSPAFSRVKSWPITYKELLLCNVDLYPRAVGCQQLINLLGQYSTAEPEKQRLTSWLVTASAWRTDVVSPRLHILDILTEILPSCTPPVMKLIECLPALQPRYYSIASSPYTSTHQLDIAFSLVAYKAPKGKDRQGICTTWLAGICERFVQEPQAELTIPVFLKPNAEFLLPVDLKTPLIMIGPGTGVAPFIAFLQHRRHMIQQKRAKDEEIVTATADVLKVTKPPSRPVSPAPSASPGRTPPCSPASKNGKCNGHNGHDGIGETHLFFGCRSHETDYLFCDQLEEFVKDGTLTYLHTAFSQEAEEGKWYGGSYVQDRLMEASIHICHLMLFNQAYLFVCGDAQSMARDVNRVLLDMLEEVEHLSRDEAKEVLAFLSKKGRYQKDIY